MPKMINVKRETDAEDAYKMTSYPHGLCLYLNAEQCEKMGLEKTLKTGTEVTISAKGIVISATEDLARNKDDTNAVSLRIQITEMGVDVGALLKDAATVLYGTES